MYVLKSGTPVARESAANLVSLLSTDPTARARFAELNVEALLTRLAEIGSPSGKKAANKALQLLRSPIPPQSTKVQPTKTFKAKESVDTIAVEQFAQETQTFSFSFSPSSSSSSSRPSASNKEAKTTIPKKQIGFVNNYRLRAPIRSSHI